MATTPTPPPTTPAAPNAIDLATVADVKGYLGIAPTATGDDATIQRLITGASQHWLNRTSRPSLNTVDHYLDHYHGNGQNELMTRQYPVQDVFKLSIDGAPIPQSTDYQAPGWVLNNKRDTLVLLGNFQFWRGRMNVMVEYAAGYDGVPDDIREAVVKQVAVNYKRRQTIDQSTLALPNGGGTTSWRSWEVPPEVERVIEFYRPWSMSS